MKKILSTLLAGVMLASTLTACGKPAASDDVQTNPQATSPTAMSGTITVVTREEGSGTRGAFIELTGVQGKDAAGNKVDNTTVEAVVANKTDVVLANVAGDEMAIGYVSLGSLNDSVKALQIDGVDATAENVKAGTYTLSRPFNIATAGAPTGVAADFIRFILSKEGQAVVSNGYIPVNETAEAFKSDGSAGAITVGGSSSISPIMEKLIDAYQAINSGAKIELQTSDSTAGMTGATDGTFAIGMASRALKDSESALTGTVIALDGIAVVTNKNNTVNALTTDQVCDIYTATATDWADIA